MPILTVFALIAVAIPINYCYGPLFFKRERAALLIDEGLKKFPEAKENEIFNHVTSEWSKFDFTPCEHHTPIYDLD